MKAICLEMAQGPSWWNEVVGYWGEGVTMATQICIDLSSCQELLLGLAFPFQGYFLSPSPGLSAEPVLGQG